MNQNIKKIEVSLVASPVRSGFQDATRKVETVGLCIVEVTTDQGLTGIGVTYHEVGGEAIKSLIDGYYAPKLVGRSPFETEVIWEELFHYARGVGRKGLAFCALSAVDIALWDLKGKILGMPLYRLMGGTKRNIPIYASGGWTSYSDEELVEEAVEMVARGYRAIKLKVGVNGGRDIQADVRRCRKVREAIGSDIEFMVDANNAFHAADAVRLANRLREYEISMFEEPVFADDIPGLAKFAASTDIPLGTGEHEYTKYGVRDLLLGHAVDYLQTDITRCGGFTEMLKIAALSQAWNIALAPHAMEYIHMHIAGAMSNTVFLERLFLFEDITGRVFKGAPLPVNGILEIPDKPGLGLELDKEFIMEQNKN
ncbi:mandelate racemase/muconate lactonizing enzyme family protein [Blautia schinkii]|nr:mandelate racemase/muconate lactonizing enzyme family protein [Blautia schinkii]